MQYKVSAKFVIQECVVWNLCFCYYKKVVNDFKGWFQLVLVLNNKCFIVILQQMKRKLEDVIRKLEQLYDRLRENSVSEQLPELRFLVLDL